MPGAGTPGLGGAGHVAGTTWSLGIGVAYPHGETYKLWCLVPEPVLGAGGGEAEPGPALPRAGWDHSKQVPCGCSEHNLTLNILL